MYRSMKMIMGLTLGLVAQTSALASPKQLITHNLTDYESNAFVAGLVPSPHPTKPHSDGKVSWTAVRMSCFGHIIDDKCTAIIKVATETDNPIEIGTVELNVETGEITPKEMHSNGYKVIVNGIAESTVSVDD